MTWDPKDSNPASEVVEITARIFELGHTCAVCRERVPMKDGFLPYTHQECVTCPECSSTFVLWQSPQPRRNYTLLRCMECLHKWHGKEVP
jgi:DNA-directed RNA polymerase subunit M/transcription elongation factor TFIIS